MNNYKKLTAHMVALGATLGACSFMAASPSLAEAPDPVVVAQVDQVDSAKEARPVKTKRVYLGRAPYICSPSGYGQKARCFLRSSLQ